MTAPSSYDPRGIVTPEAFSVSPDLLGLRLASPRRRLAAIVLDLLFIGIITLLTRSFALVLGVVISVALVRASTRRTQVRGNVFDRARRLSLGLLGVVVGLATIGIWVAVAFDDDDFDPAEDDRGGFVFDLGSARVDVDGDGSDVVPAATLEPRDADVIREGAALYTTEEALEAYAELLRSGADTETDLELRQALQARLAVDLAGDTLDELAGRLASLEDDLRDEERRRERVEEELEETTTGLLGRLSSFLDDLGFGFGWAALYTTVLLAMTNGQTLGKRIMGVRVVRLDGQRINGWVAFERAGGYAAGFATGLLGFAQVFWDANRQAIHDRIVGTVVVREGAERVTDWEAAL